MFLLGIFDLLHTDVNVPFSSTCKHASTGPMLPAWAQCWHTTGCVISHSSPGFMYHYELHGNMTSLAPT